MGRFPNHPLRLGLLIPATGAWTREHDVAFLIGPGCRSKIHPAANPKARSTGLPGEGTRPIGSLPCCAGQRLAIGEVGRYIIEEGVPTLAQTPDSPGPPLCCADVSEKRRVHTHGGSHHCARDRREYSDIQCCQRRFVEATPLRRSRSAGDLVRKRRFLTRPG